MRQLEKNQTTSSTLTETLLFVDFVRLRDTLLYLAVREQAARIGTELDCRRHHHRRVCGCIWCVSGGGGG